MASALPSSAQRLTSMAGLALVVGVAGFTVDSLQADSTDPSVSGAEQVDVVEEEVIDVATLTSTLNVVGSPLVESIVVAQADGFASVAPSVTINVEASSTAAGAQSYCEGGVAMAMTDRLFTEAEQAACADSGVEVIEIRKAVEGLTLVTAADSPIECLSFNDVYAALSADADGFSAWSEVSALSATWGGTEVPFDGPLTVFGPDPSDHSFVSLTEVVLAPVASGATGLDPDTFTLTPEPRRDYTIATDDDIVAAVAQAGAIGWMDFGAAEHAAEDDLVSLVRLSEADAGQCVSATEETVASGAYPGAKFLYLYINPEIAQDDPALGAFVDYTFTDEGQAAIADAGYVELPNLDKTRGRTIWRAQLTGTGQWEE